MKDRSNVLSLLRFLSLLLLFVSLLTGCNGGGDNSVTYSLYGLNFSPYIDGQDPNQGSQISEKQLRARMEIIAPIGQTRTLGCCNGLEMGIITPYTEWIRTFGCSNGLESAGLVAHELGLKAAIGAWLSADLSSNEREIANLISVAQAGQADMLIVGSEVLRRGDLTEEQLIGYINRVKQAIPSEIPVATADVYSVIFSHPALIEATDVVLVNYYPFWEGIAVEEALAAIHGWHQKVRAKAKDKVIIVSETGWPSCGNQVGDAVPSPENASFYFLNFVSWARANNVPYIYFEAFDESWKAAYEGPQGACWGIWDKDGSLKPEMQDVFDDKVMQDNWSSSAIPGGPGNPCIELTYIPPYGSFEDLKGQVWHVEPADYKIAVYIYVLVGWWTKPCWDSPRTSIQSDGSWVCDITTGGTDQNATRIVAYLLPNGYDLPLGYGEATLPSELDQNAVAKVETTRAPGMGSNLDTKRAIQWTEGFSS